MHSLLKTYLLLSSSLALAMNAQSTSIRLSSIINKTNNKYIVQWQNLAVAQRGSTEHILTHSVYAQQTSMLNLLLLKSSAHKQCSIDAGIQLQEISPQNSLLKTSHINVSLQTSNILKLAIGYQEDIYHLDNGKEYALSITIASSKRIKADLFCSK